MARAAVSVVRVSCFLLLSASAYAQSQEPPATPTPVWTHVSLTGSGLLSVQPALSNCCSPYLDHPLGGAVPGLAVTFSAARPAGFLMIVELSTTTSMSTFQSGRIVAGTVPVLGEHRDTFVSILAGSRKSSGNGAFEFTGGGSFVFGSSRQGGEPIQEYGVRFAVTGGVDGAIPINPRMAVVPSARYSSVFRRYERSNLGLGNNVFRLGVGLRINLHSR